MLPLWAKPATMLSKRAWTDRPRPLHVRTNTERTPKISASGTPPPGVRKRFEVAYTKLRNAPDAPPARMRSLEITMHQMHRLFFGILLPDNMT
jgi:hypothetical protein